MEANYAPFNWSQTSVTDNAIEISNSPGEYANGYDLQIAVHLAEELDLELEIVKLEWDGLPPALESGMIDAIIAGMTPTPERKEQLDFSNSYYTSDLVLVVNSNSELATAQTLEDFAGMRVTDLILVILIRRLRWGYVKVLLLSKRLMKHYQPFQKVNEIS